MTGQRPDNPLKHRIAREVTEATQTLALAPQLAEARRAGDIDSSFAQFAKSGIKAVLIAPDAMLWLESKRIARLAIAAGIADTQFSREGAEAGSLFSYATNLPEVARQTSDYVVTILLGTRPQDLPMMQPTKFELLINLKPAKALGLTISQSC